MSLNIYLFLTNYRFKRTRCFFKSHTSISQKPCIHFTKATRPFHESHASVFSFFARALFQKSRTRPTSRKRA